MPGSPGHGLHQARDASLQAAKPEHATEKDAPERRVYAADAVSAAARTQMLPFCAASAILPGKSQSEATTFRDCGPIWPSAMPTPPGGRAAARACP